MPRSLAHELGSIKTKTQVLVSESIEARHRTLMPYARVSALMPRSLVSKSIEADLGNPVPMLGLSAPRLETLVFGPGFLALKLRSIEA